MAATSTWSGSAAFIGGAAFITRSFYPHIHPFFGVVFGVTPLIFTRIALSVIPQCLYFKSPLIERGATYTLLTIGTYGFWKVLESSGNTATPVQIFLTTFGSYICAEAAGNFGAAT